MALEIGIVGLPNVGKSTLFNALTDSSILAANYPFATIEPNTGIVPVPDERLQKLAELYNSKKIVPATVTFVDIAGLVAGASKGEGLGNQFLAHIRTCNAILQVVRAFDSGDILRSDSSRDPAHDIDVIKTELVLADLQTVTNRLPRVQKEARANPKLAPAATALQEINDHLNSGKALWEDKSLLDSYNEHLADLQLMTAKEIIYLFNIDDDKLADEPFKTSLQQIVTPAKLDLPKTSQNSGASRSDSHTVLSAGGVPVGTKTTEKQNVDTSSESGAAGILGKSSKALFVSAKLEDELRGLDESDRNEMLESYGQKESGLVQVIHAAYEALGLQSYLTAGEQEVRAWTIKKGSTAPQAAGVIHGDFEKGFIAAQIVDYDDLMAAGSEAAAKAAGKLRTEGKTYIMRPGDIVEFRFNN